MQDTRNKNYWDISVVRAFLFQQPDVFDELQRAVGRSGERYRLFTSVLTPSLLLTDAASKTPEREQGLTASIEALCRVKNAKLERVACHEVIADRVGFLMRRANAEGLKLELKTAIELATADCLRVAAFETFDAKDLKKFAGITDTHFKVVSPIGLERELPLFQQQAASNEDGSSSASEQAQSPDTPAKPAYNEMFAALGLDDQASAGAVMPLNRQRKSK